MELLVHGFVAEEMWKEMGEEWRGSWRFQPKMLQSQCIEAPFGYVMFIFKHFGGAGQIGPIWAIGNLVEKYCFAHFSCLVLDR